MAWQSGQDITCHFLGDISQSGRMASFWHDGSPFEELSFFFFGDVQVVTLSLSEFLWPSREPI